MEHGAERRPVTKEEYIAESGAESYREFFWAPLVEEADTTKSHKCLARKMQSRHEVNAAAERAGVGSIFDLPSWDDDETISIEDLEPRECDDAGAGADQLARREAENR